MARKPTGRTARKTAAAEARKPRAGSESKPGPNPGPKPDPDPAPTSGGLDAMQTAVTFTADQVTAKSGELLGAMEDPVGEQAAAMMMGDLRGYLQGSEQIIMAASAQAMKLLLDPATQETGTAALAAIATWQGDLTKFAGDVVTQATAIKTEFSS